mmetsp:Transcript_90497/g.260870  ORF Transcript_90497/g.260870 Transcript_90497/m.260870 type:complete len:419 (+) Transcript_90497:542-1798(+)
MLPHAMTPLLPAALWLIAALWPLTAALLPLATLTMSDPVDTSTSTPLLLFSSLCFAEIWLMLSRTFCSNMRPMRSSRCSMPSSSSLNLAFTTSLKMSVSFSIWPTMFFNMHVVVFGSVFFILNMTSMNSFGSISPLPSVSTISNKRRKSPRSMSRTRSQCRNSATRSAAASNSSYDNAPLSSSSILANNLLNTRFSDRSCCSMSAALVVTSFSRASAKVSTMTATTKLSTPQTKVINAPTKMVAVHGCASITGTAIMPQESPAMIVLKNVMFAMNTEENARLQRSQFDQTPLPDNSWMMGLISSTATAAQKVITKARRKNDQNNVFTQPPTIWINRLSSFRNGIAWITRSSRNNRQQRNVRMMLAPCISMPAHATKYSNAPIRTMPVSIKFHPDLGNSDRSATMRKMSSTTKTLKHAC